uniref:Uncharacterized protein n=1 Tax=Gossypium raimondii TaxID=29730 RepID=A0A0D2S3T9_GOSRA|nr:hypothetical protein B456_007G031600 [Gossypium raimondii]
MSVIFRPSCTLPFPISFSFRRIMSILFSLSLTISVFCRSSCRGSLPARDSWPCVPRFSSGCPHSLSSWRRLHHGSPLNGARWNPNLFATAGCSYFW